MVVGARCVRAGQLSILCVRSATCAVQMLCHQARSRSVVAWPLAPPDACGWQRDVAVLCTWRGGLERSIAGLLHRSVVCFQPCLHTATQEFDIKRSKCPTSLDGLEMRVMQHGACGLRCADRHGCDVT
jgi:hypothetical protein